MQWGAGEGILCGGWRLASVAGLANQSIALSRIGEVHGEMGVWSSPDRTCLVLSSSQSRRIRRSERWKSLCGGRPRLRLESAKLLCFFAQLWGAAPVSQKSGCKAALGKRAGSCWAPVECFSDVWAGRRDYCKGELQDLVERMQVCSVGSLVGAGAVPKSAREGELFWI